MEKRYRNLGMAMLLALALPATIQKTFAQETIEITPELSKKLQDNYDKIFLIENKVLDETNRTGFIITAIYPTDEFLETFEIHPQHYKRANETVNGKFIENELVDEERKINSYMLSERNWKILKRQNGNELYAIADNVLKDGSEFKMNKEMFAVIHKLGYREYKDGQDYRFKSKTCDIQLNAQTYNELKKNPDYIKQLDADQAKIATLVKQTIPHSKTLNSYISTYNIKRSKTPVATLNAWKSATAQAIKLNKQIYVLTEKNMKETILLPCLINQTHWIYS